MDQSPSQTCQLTGQPTVKSNLPSLHSIQNWMVNGCRQQLTKSGTRGPSFSSIMKIEVPYESPDIPLSNEVW